MADLTQDMLVRLFMPSPNAGSRFARLQTTLASLGDLAAWLSDGVTGSIAALSRSVADLTAGVAGLQQQAAAQGQSLAALTSSEAADAQAIAALQASVASAAQQIAALLSSEAADASAIKALQTNLAALQAAVAALQARFPDPFTVSVAFSGLLAVGKQPKTITNLPAVKKGDRILVTPGAALPGNMMLGAAFAPADGQVTIEFGLLAAVTLSDVTLPLTLTVLR